MRIDHFLTTDAAVAELGRRIERHRLERNQTQQQLADEAGVSRATLQRLERGQSVQLTSLIGLLRVLGLVEGLDVLVPEPLPSPLDRLRTRGRRRQRARPSADADEPAAPWTWESDVPGSPPSGQRHADEPS